MISAAQAAGGGTVERDDLSEGTFGSQDSDDKCASHIEKIKL